MALAQEGGHFYDRQGNPVYEVPRADGKGNRPATLADARKLNLFPGSTGIIACADRPPLRRWGIRQAVLAALTYPNKGGLTGETLIEAILDDSQEQVSKAAEKGIRIHAAIESYYRNEFRADVDWMKIDKVVARVVAEVADKYGAQNWLPEKSFTCEYGYGCKIDLVSPKVIIDFKSKEFSDTSKKLAWDEHAMQLAANRVASDYLNAKCTNVFVSTSIPGLVHIHEWTEEELDRAWKKFKALLDYWQADRNYKPVW